MPYRAVATLAALGLAETTYLTAAKLAHVDVVCPLSGGCAEILTSEYSNLLGVVPISALGMVAYGAVALLSLSGARALAAQREAAEAPLRSAVLAAGVAMASCSGYLMGIMLTQFDGEMCPWCVGSAALSFTIFGLVISGLRRRELEQAAGPGLGLVATCVMALSLTLGTPGGAEAGSKEITELPFREPVVTAASSERAVDLAARLRAAGARMYGAFWCGHCYQQKEAFGREAMAQFPYVECFPNGWRRVRWWSQCPAAAAPGACVLLGGGSGGLRGAVGRGSGATCCAAMEERVECKQQQLRVRRLPMPPCLLSCAALSTWKPCRLPEPPCHGWLCSAGRAHGSCLPGSPWRPEGLPHLGYWGPEAGGGSDL